MSRETRKLIAIRLQNDLMLQGQRRERVEGIRKEGRAYVSKKGGLKKVA